MDLLLTNDKHKITKLTYAKINLTFPALSSDYV